MLRSIARNTIRINKFATYTPATVQARTMATNERIEGAAQAAGEAKDTNPKAFNSFQTYPQLNRKTDRSLQNPSVISSAGAIGKQFNPDGNIGQIGEKIGGPFSKVHIPRFRVLLLRFRFTQVGENLGSGTDFY